jgi:endoglucanase
MKNCFSTVFIFLILICLNVFSESQTPVALHGQLQVRGASILDQYGNTAQLHGVSFFWSQWMEKFYNSGVVNWLVDDWKVSIVRAAMGVKHDETISGYIYNGSEANKVNTIVDASIKKGIYVIIDWHDHYAFNNIKESKRFFQKMAQRYGTYPNVIYEIFNEPIDVSWSDIVKPYAEELVRTIRSIDPDNLIIIGSPHWSQDVDSVADNPVAGNNLVYALHFYAATHGADLRKKAEYAIGKGTPLFVSEFGTCLSTGDGFLDSLETEHWFAFMDKHSLSWCNWSLGDKNETASVLVPGARYYGKWSPQELSASGKIIRRKCRQYAGIIEKETLPDLKKAKPRLLKFTPL